MARRAKPTELHRLHGTFNPTRHGDRLEPLAPGDIAALRPPADLDKLQRQRWKIAVTNAPRSILRNIDAGLLRLYCILEATSIVANRIQQRLDATTDLPLLIKGARDRELVISPYVKEQRRIAVTLTRIASELGFSPASRASMTADDDAAEIDDRWDYLMRTATPARPSKALTKKLAGAGLADTETEGEA
jgi:phage terminase small subunit